MLFLTQLFGVTGSDADLSSGIEQVKRILGRWLSLGFHRRSHDFPGNNDLDAAVLPATLGCAVLGYEILHAETLRRQRAVRQALANKVVAQRDSAYLRERLIELGAACRAGSTAIAVANSGVEGGGSVQCLRN